MLIVLSADEDGLVRDWATFGIGTQSDRDTPAIRAALMARVGDPDEYARNEAMMGLARRQVRDVVPYLIRELERDEPYEFVYEALEEIAAPEFIPPLRALAVRRGDEYGQIFDVIETIKQVNGIRE